MRHFKLPEILLFLLIFTGCSTSANFRATLVTKTKLYLNPVKYRAVEQNGHVRGYHCLEEPLFIDGDMEEFIRTNVMSLSTDVLPGTIAVRNVFVKVETKHSGLFAKRCVYFNGTAVKPLILLNNRIQKLYK